MRIKLLKPSETTAKLVVAADAKDLQPIKMHTLTKLSSQVRLPGFRAGKAPLALVEKNLDQNLLHSEFLNEAINHLYNNAVKEQLLRPIAEPSVQLKKFVPFTELEFEVELEILGDIVLADYKKIRKSRAEVEVKASDINAVIESLRQRLAEKTDVDRPAKSGDQVVIDFKGTDVKGEPINGADGKDFPLLLGSNSFIPGFEQNLVGLKTGAIKKFELVFPKDYGVKALAAKKVSFEVKIKGVQNLDLPKVDDSFASKVGPFKTAAELRADIKKSLTTERQHDLDRQFESELVESIAEKSRVAVPKRFIEEEVDRQEQAERQNLAYRGQTWEEHLKAEGLTAEAHRDQKRPEAEKRAKAGLVLAEIAELEKINVTADDIDTRLKLLKAQYKDSAMQAELDKPAAKQEIANRLITEKTIDSLVRYATANSKN